MVAVRLATFVVYFLLGLGTGFVLWGSRVDGLNEALNRMILEDDVLRTRLAVGSETNGAGPVLSSLSLLSSEIRMQAELIDQQSKALDRLTSGREHQLEASLARCTEAETRLQTQLEGCLFAENRAHRSAARSEPSQARTGTAEIRTTIQTPQEAVEEVRR